MCFVIGSFLVDDISTLVLFDSGATRSFLSLALSKRFFGAPGELDCPLDVEIVDDRTIRLGGFIGDVHCSCSMRSF